MAVHETLRPAIALLAGGASRRMAGRDKLLEEVDGRPLLRAIAEAALAASPARVLAALPPQAHAPARWEALAGLPLRALSVVDCGEGIAASIRTAARAARAEGMTHLLILPADMPEITGSDLRRVLDALPQAPDAVWRASDAEGRPGHPVAFPARLFPALTACRGDIGARGVIDSEEVRIIPLPGRHATTDLDTPEAWAAWRAARG